MNQPQCLKRMVELLSSFSLYRKSKKHPSDFENTNQLVKLFHFLIYKEHDT